MIYILIAFIVIMNIIYFFINNKKTNTIENNKNINLDNFICNGYIMTQTELIFYRELKKVTDNLNVTIFPQINLERLIGVKNNNFADRNRIKSRSIDFAIVNNNNCKIICCIELDDYTHNRKKSIENDNFKNELFKKVNIPLHRIKVTNNYNLDEITSIIKGDI